MIYLAKKTDTLRSEVARAIGQLGSAIRPIYTSNPEDVIRLIDPDVPSLIVSGQVFRMRMLGTQLAGQVKARCPGALFVLWSQHSVESPDIDMVIPDGIDAVSRVVKLFAVYQSGMTIEDLVKEAR